jgi:two-component system, sensor histidine kinase
MNFDFQKSSYRRLFESAANLAAQVLNAEMVVLMVDSVEGENLVIPSQAFETNTQTLLGETVGNDEGYKYQQGTKDSRANNEVQEELLLTGGMPFGRLIIQGAEILEVDRWSRQLEMVKDHYMALYERMMEEQEANIKASRLLELLSNVSHEIRTPLHALFGHTQVLRDSPLNEQQADIVENILNSEQLLMNLVNVVLDFSETQQEKFQLILKPTLLGDVMEEVQDLYCQLAENKGLGLKVDLEDVDLPVMVDPLRLSQVLGNLVNNALKFTDQGEVCLKAERLGPTTYRFEVKDTGKGVSKDFQQAIFEPYVQDVNKDIYGGTGLGLAICHNLVAKQNGAMGVESPVKGEDREVQGTRIWFTIEAEVCQEELKEKEAVCHEFAGRKVLLIDDDATIQALTKRMLEKEKVQSAVANSGEEALRYLQDNQVDAIFLDVSMSGLDGFETAALIRQELDIKVPLVFFSSYREQEIREKAMDSGFTHFLPKPFNLRTMRKILMELSTMQ